MRAGLHQDEDEEGEQEAREVGAADFGGSLEGLPSVRQEGQDEKDVHQGDAGVLGLREQPEGLAGPQGGELDRAQGPQGPDAAQAQYTVAATTEGRMTVTNLGSWEF